jgi:ADP-heptose:LPS heptosyltransferase
VKVLLVRVDGIGDALACTPLLAALHGAGHDVGALLGKTNQAIFADRALRWVHSLERVAWPGHGSPPAARSAVLAEARAIGYDVALIASEEIDAYTFARAAGIATRVGFVNGWEKPLKTLQVRALLTRSLVRPASAARVREHEVRTLFRLGAGLHGEAEPARDPARLGPLVLDAPVRGHGRVAVQSSRKLAAAGFDRSAYVALLRELRARGHAPAVLGEDAEYGRAIARDADVACETGLSVRAWKEAIAGAAALVTPDSGAAHVAGMLGVPCVDIFAPGPTTAYDAVRWRPWAAPERIVVLDPRSPPSATARRLANALDDVLATLVAG